MQDLTSRKFLLGILLTVLSTVFVYTGKMSADQWKSFQEWVMITYIVGNVAQSVGMTVRGK